MANEKRIIVDANVVATAIFSPIVTSGLCTSDTQCASGFYCDTNTVLRYDDNGGGDPYANPVYACKPIPNPSPTPTPSPSSVALTVNADPKTVEFSAVGQTILQGALISKKIDNTTGIWRSNNSSVASVTTNPVTPIGAPETGYTVVTQITATGLGRTTVAIEYQGVSDAVQVIVGTPYRICTETTERFTSGQLPPTGYQFIAANNCYSPTPTSYTVTVTNSPGGNAIIKNQGNSVGTVTTVTQGTPLSLEASPTTGYRFVRWEFPGGGTDTRLIVPIVANANLNATAIFEVVTKEQIPTRIVINGQSSLTVQEVSRPYTATVYDQDDNVMQRTIRWSSRRSEIAIINSSGVVTAITPGTATIRAETDNLSIEKNIIVSEIPPTWRVCNESVPRQGTPDLTRYIIANDTTGTCYREIVAGPTPTPSTSRVVGPTPSASPVVGPTPSTSQAAGDPPPPPPSPTPSTSRIVIVGPPDVTQTPTWRVCEQSVTRSGIPDLSGYYSSRDSAGTCYRPNEITWRTCGTSTTSPGTPPSTYEASTDTAGVCYKLIQIQQWRDCVTGVLNTGFPPADRRQVTYSGIGGGTCWEPITPLTFSPSLSDALIFTYQRGSTTFPQSKTITVTNSSFGKVYSLAIRTNANIVITPSVVRVSARSTATFTVNVTPDLLNTLATGTSTLEMTIDSQEL